jgi:hypothetical protein
MATCAMDLKQFLSALQVGGVFGSVTGVSAAGARAAGPDQSSVNASFISGLSHLLSLGRTRAIGPEDLSSPDCLGRLRLMVLANKLACSAYTAS